MVLTTKRRGGGGGGGGGGRVNLRTSSSWNITRHLPSTRKSFVNCEEKGGVSGSGGRVDSAFSKEGVHIRRDVMGTSEIATADRPTDHLTGTGGEGEVEDFVDVSKRPTAVPTCTRSISRCQGFPKARV